MITDAQLRLSTSQSLAAVAGTYVSTNTIDLLSAFTNAGIGEPVRVFVTADIQFVGGTSVRVEVIQSDNADLSSPDILVTGPTLLTAALVPGARLLDSPLPQNTKRYIGVRYITVGTFSAGTVTANCIEDVDHMTYLPMNTGR